MRLRLFAKLAASLALLLSPALLGWSPASAQDAAALKTNANEPAKLDTSRGDVMIAEYFRSETKKLQEAALKDITTEVEWEKRKPEMRRELLEMLGLDPLPERTDLQATITGKIEQDEFTVEKLHFQSRPGLYVTGSLYLPKNIDKPLPAVLYVSGHGQVKKNGIAYGTKAHYQHHGAWLARNGYVCLVLDTLQLGEIEGIHHGTYRYGMWWWLNRGYTPAGVEAWNCVRALDYLQSRKEVDPERLGVTGRSGGGAYSWWIAAIDERIKCAVPTAGITDLQNHVVDGAVEGHCDCMFMVNTYRWDYPMVAALVAPRPLLIANTDSDRIFPLDGVVRTFDKVRRIYRLLGAGDKVALNITAGGHLDTQELQIHAIRWLDKHLKGENRLIENAAVPFFEPEMLKVFDQLPADQKNTEIHETFVPPAPPPTVPKDNAAWQQMANAWRDELLEKSFRAWPTENAPPLDTREIFDFSRNGLRFQAHDFTSQDNIRLRLYIVESAAQKKRDLVVLNVLDQRGWNDFAAAMRVGFEKELKGESLPPPDAPGFQSLQKMLQEFPWVMAYVAPRGIGPTAWDQSEKKQVQNRRRFYLLGQTLDGMQTWDIRRAIQTVRSLDSFNKPPLWLQSQRTMAGNTLYASLFEPDIKRLDLYELPHTHRDGPYYLNVRRILDLPTTVALAGEHTSVVLYDPDPTAWQYPRAVATALKWDAAKPLQLRKPPEEEK
jgi:dienelactone hydrolase